MSAAAVPTQVVYAATPGATLGATPVTYAAQPVSYVAAQPGTMVLGGSTAAPVTYAAGSAAAPVTYVAGSAAVPAAAAAPAVYSISPERFAQIAAGVPLTAEEIDALVAGASAATAREADIDAVAKRTPIVGGNWKCNPASTKDVEKLLEAWKGTSFDKSKVEVVICPTNLHLHMVKTGLEAMGMQVATQNVSATGFGAFTGEHTAEHLVDFGVAWTLIGHSERRTKYGETDEVTAAKIEQCQAKGVCVLFCIGESLEEREAGKTDEVNRRQIAAILPKVQDWDKIVIAYEPVWAIGTGKVATPEQAQEAHAAIRAYLREAAGMEVAEKVRIQYGGSVTPENCAELISKPDIDGFLVGGASLKPTFMDIIKAAEAATTTTEGEATPKKKSSKKKSLKGSKKSRKGCC